MLHDAPVLLPTTMNKAAGPGSPPLTSLLSSDQNPQSTWLTSFPFPSPPLSAGVERLVHDQPHKPRTYLHLAHAALQAEAAPRSRSADSGRSPPQGHHPLCPAYPALEEALPV